MGVFFGRGLAIYSRVTETMWTFPAAVKHTVGNISKKKNRGRKHWHGCNIEIGNVMCVKTKSLNLRGILTFCPEQGIFQDFFKTANSYGR